MLWTENHPHLLSLGSWAPGPVLELISAPCLADLPHILLELEVSIRHCSSLLQRCVRVLACVRGTVRARGAGHREGGCANFGDVKSRISQVTVSRQGSGEGRQGQMGWGVGRGYSFYYARFCWPGLSWNHCCRPARSRQLQDSELILLIENLELIKCIYLKS